MAPPRRDPPRTAIGKSKPTTPRPAAKPVEAAGKPTTAAKTPAGTRDGAPIVNMSFDDDNNTTAPSGKP
ncbi:MAG TPA: hypothetical protein VFP84_30480 [Kofleriaceae bacterium]|nr:hypothetical protein [Kofleriaceae bacterium]